MTYEPWNELFPAGGDSAGSLWDHIQQAKRQVRERLASVFSDWSTATDRLTAIKLFVNAASGLTIRNATDTTDYVKITKDGFFHPLLPYKAALYLASAYSGTPGVGNWKFTGTPTELFDPVGFHTGANPWRFTIPTGETGKYKVTLGAKHQQTAGSLNFPHSFAIFKNGAVDQSVGFNVSNTNVNSWWFSPVMSLNAGDYVEPYFSAYGGYSYSITEAFFTIERIG